MSLYPKLFVLEANIQKTRKEIGEKEKSGDKM